VTHNCKHNYPVVKFDDVTLQIDDKLLFENTFWEIRKGQHWAVLGKNGSGKSTIINAICREVSIVSGKIEYFFKNGSKPGPFFVKNQIVKISPDVHSKLMRTQSGYHQARWNSIEGEDSITLCEFLSDSCEINEEKKQKVINQLGIQYLLNRKIMHLSDGEGRKLLIAQALMQSPNLLILDEPFCGLDNNSRGILMNTIDDLLHGNITVVLVTQRLEEIPQDITHILCVDNNQVIQKGPKEQILISNFVQEVFSDGKDETYLANPVQKKNKKDSILVEMKNTSVSYRGIQILKDINWKMYKGENWAILGHNGAGKSTLLSLILADNPQAYANDIYILGKSRGTGESIWDVKSKIGWLSPEIQNYYPWNTTCQEVVCSGFFDTMGLYRKPSVEQKRAANEWMAKLEIEELKDKRFGELSRSQQRMVLLARALVKEPCLLIMDEPCQGLDGNHRIKITETVEQLCSQMSVNLIYVTHHFDEIPKCITHVMKLRKGKIDKIGRRDKILAH